MSSAERAMARRAAQAQKAEAARGVVDLSAKTMTPEQVQAVGAEIELMLGQRCRGCGKRIGIGFRFTSVDPTTPERSVMQLAACSRPECAFADSCRHGATSVEQIEFVWLDEAGLEAPPERRIAEMNERLAREAHTADGVQPAAG